jgi:PhoH-like ATPase
MKNKKSWLLDTNILLDDPQNIIKLSNNSKNLIIIPETVIDELDSKKTGFDIISYHAREFNRMMSDSEIVGHSNINHTAKRVIVNYQGCEIHLVSLLKYDTTIENTDVKILNDRKIIECALKISKEYPNLLVLSNDIAFRSKCILENINVEPYKTDNKKETEIEFFKSFETQHEISLPILEVEKLEKDLGVEIPKSISGIEIINPKTGINKYYYKVKDKLYEIDEDLLQKQNAVPMNREQRVLSSLILADNTDIIVVPGQAGTGKTLMALSGACALIEKKNSKFEKIIYIRKTITSVDNKQEELGFLPGTLEEKMGGYLAPLYNSIEKLVKRKYKNTNLRDKEVLEEKMKEFISKYRIEPAYEGFLRGSTLENSVIIIDEAQNESRSSMRLILSRIGQNSKVIVLGHNRQLDNPYCNALNNGFTYLCNETEKENEFDVNIVGCRLIKVVRSKIAKYGDEIRVGR